MSKKKKRVFLVIAIIIILIAALFLGFSYFLGTQIVASSTQLITNEETKDVHETLWEEYGFNYDEFCQTYTIESMELTSSFDGHMIPADFIYADDRNSDVVIMAHGLGGNRRTNYPIAEFFLENGYNVITYDQRSSGENTAKKTTFGYWKNMTSLIAYIMQRNLPRKRKLGCGVNPLVELQRYRQLHIKISRRISHFLFLIAL